MSQLMGLRICICLFCLFCVAASAADPDSAVDQALSGLKHNSPEVRLGCLRELMTSLDPRIPDALLPLLRDEGDSIRRLAARAIGSRWWQIPAGDRQKFVRALKQNLEQNEAEMARRGIALLSGDYGSSGVVFPSPSGRWVVYERRKLPCVIDTRNGNEELVGWEPESSGELKLFSAVWGERQEDLPPAALWHPRREMVALSVQYWRWPSVVWIWRPGYEIRRIEVDEVLDLLASQDKHVSAGAQADICSSEWKGNSLILNFLFYDEEGKEMTATFRWNADTDKLALVDVKKAPL